MEVILNSMNMFSSEPLEYLEIGRIPVIASGGAGTKEHFYDALTKGKADAALAASLFHYKELEIRDLKQYLRERGISVRL